ncbi:MerR family transcriptional regulator [Rugosimonospora africana]|nr:MerR family transcriptional regulator [Rugosimonospora africana]
MRVGELARRTGTTIRALRYYESLGLVMPQRLDNGYREYPSIAVELVEQIQTLTALGLRVEDARPFVECLADGHDEGDMCPAALATYRRSIVDLDERIARLAAQRDSLRARLDAAAGRGIGVDDRGPVASIPHRDPEELIGRRVGVLRFAATDGGTVDLGDSGCGLSIVFVYPLTGRPGVDLPDGFTEIPGARGCTEETCGFRDHHRDLLDAGAARVVGLSAQSSGYQRELVHRLRLTYPLLADPRLTAARALGLPTFTTGGMTLYRRLTLIVADGVVEHVFTSIPNPADHAEAVLAWLKERNAR